MSDLEQLAARLARSPSDPDGAVTLARAYMRAQDPVRARQTLVACEAVQTRGHPCDGIRAAASALSRLRQERIELGLYALETSIADEWLTWPARALSAPAWIVRAARQCHFESHPALAFKRTLLVPLQRTRTRATEALVAIDLERGEEIWRRDGDGARLVDVRLAGTAMALVHWLRPLADATEAERRTPTRNHGRHWFEWLNLADGSVEGHWVPEPWCHVTPLLRLEDWLVTIGQDPAEADNPVWSRRHRLGLLDQEMPGLAWQPCDEMPRGLVLVAHVSATGDPPPVALLSSVLDLDPELVLGLFVHRTRDGYLLFVQTQTGPRLYRMSPTGDVEEVDRPTAPPASMMVLPRFYRCGDRILGTLRAHESGLHREGLVLGPTPGDVIRQSVSDVWQIVGTTLEGVALGHPDADDAVLASGVWMALKAGTRRRVITYTSSLRGTLPLWELETRARHAGRSASTWQRALPAAADLALLFGKDVIVNAGIALAGHRLVR